MAALSLSSKAFVPFRTSTTVQRPSRRNCVVKAALDPSAALAVSQQTFAFAAVVGAEAAFTGLNTPASTPGRPSLPITLAGIAGTVAGGVLTGQGDGAGTAGCIASFLAAGIMMAAYVQRVKDTPYNPNDWPGAKSWPAVMCLITFFELAVSAQGLLDAIGVLRQP